MAHCIIAGGAESMSFIPRLQATWLLLQKQETKITTGNGLTAEKLHNSLKFLEKIKMNAYHLI
jgi:hypothetical protein